MSYKISIRLISEKKQNLSSMEELISSGYKLFLKGDPVRSKSQFKIMQNMLIFDCCECEKISKDIENLLIKNLIRTKVCNNEIKRELLISNVSEKDQYGIEIPLELTKILGENNYSILFSGVFV